MVADLYIRSAKPAKPRIAIVIDGGFVRRVFASPETSIIVLDLDTEGAVDDGLSTNPKGERANITERYPKPFDDSWDWDELFG